MSNMNNHREGFPKLIHVFSDLNRPKCIVMLSEQDYLTVSHWVEDLLLIKLIEVREMVASGASLADIAKQLGITVKSLKILLKNDGRFFHMRSYGMTDRFARVQQLRGF